MGICFSIHPYIHTDHFKVLTYRGGFAPYNFYILLFKISLGESKVTVQAIFSSGLKEGR